MRIALATLACLLAAAAAAADPPARRDRAAAGRSVRSLWRESVRPPHDPNASAALRRAVRDLEAACAAPRRRASRPSPAREDKTPAAKGDPPPATQPTTAPATQPATQPAVSPEQALAKLKAAAAKGLTDPIAVANGLYDEGRLADAAEFYRIAADAQPKGQRQAWLLFQMANCQRRIDRQGAAQTFEALRGAYPESCWGRLAAAQKRLIDWRQTNRVDALLAETDDLAPAAPPAKEARPQ
jgi:hypothetical protein